MKSKDIKAEEGLSFTNTDAEIDKIMGRYSDEYIKPLL